MRLVIRTSSTLLAALVPCVLMSSAAWAQRPDFTLSECDLPGVSKTATTRLVCGFAEVPRHVPKEGSESITMPAMIYRSGEMRTSAAIDADSPDVVLIDPAGAGMQPRYCVDATLLPLVPAGTITNAPHQDLRRVIQACAQETRTLETIPTAVDVHTAFEDIR